MHNFGCSWHVTRLRHGECLLVAVVTLDLQRARKIHFKLKNGLSVYIIDSC